MPSLALEGFNLIRKPARFLPTEKNVINELGKAIIDNSENQTYGNGNNQYQGCQIDNLSSGEPDYLL